MSVNGEQGTLRFRLRFMLHEIDLQGPEVVIGRSPDCHITIEDPLVSREHVKLRITPEGIFLIDLDSRNGVQVNGQAVVGGAVLRDGDRIRLGTQEMVFSCTARTTSWSRPTGCIVVCDACQVPYPEEASHCPHCGEVRHGGDRVTDEALSSSASRHSWTAQLMVEGAEHAVAAGRAPEAERMLQRLSHHIDCELQAGQCPDERLVDQAAVAALELTVRSGDTSWLGWALDLHLRCGLLPSEQMVQHLEHMLQRQPSLGERLASFVSDWETHATASRLVETERWARLCRIAQRAEPSIA